ncbi:hypothetical protein [Streptomyces sp. NPDC007905]
MKLMAERESIGLHHAMYVRVCLWYDEEDSTEEPDFIVEVRPRSDFDAA